MDLQSIVFNFSEGDGKNKQLLGGKGANLCEMTQLGLNVPPGFVITTEACIAYLENPDNGLNMELMNQVRNQISVIEQQTGKVFGGADNPLLLSVRSGSALSMPGMMDTILNLGLNSVTLSGLIQKTNNPRFVFDAYRRFIQLFGHVALGIDDELFDQHFSKIKGDAGLASDVAMDASHLQKISQSFLDVVEKQTGRSFPDDPYEQLELAIKAVFGSWNGKRAIAYRREFNITPQMANGTAVNVCSMVYGNMGNDSATGVGFTRDPGTGENVMYGEYLLNAQGEDVVAGIRTPKPIAEMEREMPDSYQQLVTLRNKLEAHFIDVQDYEYTIEKGILFCLQTRNGKMNATARIRTAVEMVAEGLISKSEALLRVDPDLLEQLLHPALAPNHNFTSIVTGLPASPGAASGKAIFDADRAEAIGKTGERVILVRVETKPEDIHGFFASQGILTSRGGKTSHAAVVARGMGKPCVAGAEGIEVNVKNREATIGATTIREGDLITIDGSTGNVYIGEIPTVEPEFSENLKVLLGWADAVAKLKVLANADTPAAAKKAREYGAQGIGLCRTERMFNDVDRLPIVVDMILADTLNDREQILNRLLPIQRSDFFEIFKVMSPLPVTIRLLDPPLHEFLPNEQEILEDLAQLTGVQKNIQGMDTLVANLMYLDSSKVHTTLPEPFNTFNSDLVAQMIAKKQNMLNKVRQLYEVNPMQGHRGVRLGITHPEIYGMQIQAILEATAQCQKEGIPIEPEIMVPQVVTTKEVQVIKALTQDIASKLEQELGLKLSYKFGTMMESVRGILCAEPIAEMVDFFSFGTNDLTQAVFSFSREDAENKFLPNYVNKNILENNPFEVLDVTGVARLMKIAIADGRKAKPDLKVGICGEHGGHPASIATCHAMGLTYCSCSGPRVPVARLAVAQSKLRADAI